MKTIKFISLFFIFLFLTSCNTDYLNIDNEYSLNLTISSNDIFNKVTENLSLPKFKSLNQDELLNLYAIDSSILTDYVSNVPQDNTSGVEISIFRLKDKSYSSEVILGIEYRISQLENEFKSIKQTEYDLIKNPYIKVVDNYVIFALYNDLPTLENNLNNVLK